MEDKYKKPDQCPMPEEIWNDGISYCWGYACRVDEGKEAEFLKYECHPEECKRFGF